MALQGPAMVLGQQQLSSTPANRMSGPQHHAAQRHRCHALAQAPRCAALVPQLPDHRVAGKAHTIAAPAAHQQHRQRGSALAATQSVDPLSISDGIYRSGKVFCVHSAEELQRFTMSYKLTVLMAKSSHCRPCKKFAATYHKLAEHFSDSQLLEIVGDESQETRKMMVAMKVKVTPSFFIYRDTELLLTLTGTTRNVLKNAIIERLQPQEAGAGGWDDPAPQAVSSDEEDDD